MTNLNLFPAAILFLVSGACASQDQPEKIISSTKLVTVPVVVTENGKPLLDLTISDFEIEQDKKVVTISNFELIRPAPSLPKEIRLQATSADAGENPAVSNAPTAAPKQYQSL